MHQTRNIFLKKFLSSSLGPGNERNNEPTPQIKIEVSQLGIEPYSGPWDESHIMHLLRRCLFGVSQNDKKHFTGKKLAECLNELFIPSGPAEPPVNNYSSADHLDPDTKIGQTWVDKPIGSMAINGRRVYSLKTWWAGLMISQDHSLTEKMTLFWHNHFATQMQMVFDARYSYRHIALLRKHALGNFKQLTREITTDAAMLVYLNGNTNMAGAPNENYARELQELFTVGKGPGSHYTEEDVKAAARVLTGWKDQKETLSVVFEDKAHDTTDKQFSAFYNNTVIKGQTGPDGAKETDQLIDMIFNQPEVARFICRKLYRWFVYYNITDEVEKNVIVPLSEILVKNNYEIIPVMQALLGSAHFFDSINMGCLIKNPADAVIGVCRTFNVEFGASEMMGNKGAEKQNPVRSLYLGWHLAYLRMADMAMDIGDPPSVSGWPAYYQIPQYHELWINSNSLPVRNQTTDLLCSEHGIFSDGTTNAFGEGKVQVRINADVLSFTKGLQNANDLDNLIEESTAFLCPGTFDAVQKIILKKILLSGTVNDNYWTDAWADYLLHPEDPIKKSVVLNRLREYYAYIMQRAEYQLI